MIFLIDFFFVLPIGINLFSIENPAIPIENRLIPIGFRLFKINFFYKNQNYLKKKEKQNPNPIKHLIGKEFLSPSGLDSIPI